MYIIVGQDFDVFDYQEVYTDYNVCLANTENEAKKIVDYLNKNNYEEGLFKYIKISSYSLEELKNKHRYYHVYGYVTLERQNHVFKVKDSSINNLDYYPFLEYLSEDEILENNEYYMYESGDDRVPYKIHCYSVSKNKIDVNIDLPLSQDKEKTNKQFKLLENKIKSIVDNIAKEDIRSSNKYKQDIENLSKGEL